MEIYGTLVFEKPTFQLNTLFLNLSDKDCDLKNNGVAQPILINLIYLKYLILS